MKTNINEIPFTAQNIEWVRQFKRGRQGYYASEGFKIHK